MKIFFILFSVFMYSSQIVIGQDFVIYENNFDNLDGLSLTYNECRTQDSFAFGIREGSFVMNNIDGIRCDTCTTYSLYNEQGNNQNSIKFPVIPTSGSGRIVITLKVNSSGDLDCVNNEEQFDCVITKEGRDQIILEVRSEKYSVQSPICCGRCTEPFRLEIDQKELGEYIELYIVGGNQSVDEYYYIDWLRVEATELCPRIEGIEAKGDLCQGQEIVLSPDGDFDSELWTFEWIKDDILIGTERRFIIEDLSSENTGDYTFIVHGLGGCSDTTRIQIPEIEKEYSFSYEIINTSLTAFVSPALEDEKIEWYLDDKRVGESDTLRLNLEINTDYIVCSVIESLDCTISLCEMIRITSTSTIDKEKEINVIVFPNPTKDEVVLQNYIGRFELLDTNGKMINTGKIGENGKISLVSYSKGIYFLKIKDGVFKIIKL